MKLSKKQRAQLNSVYIAMMKAETFIYSSNTIVGIKTNVTCAKEDTLINQGTGEKVCAINKEVGSDLCYFSNAIGLLNNFLNTNQQV